MRISAGGLYEIDGRTLRAASAAPAGPADRARLRSLQDDLWTESSRLLHVHHRMSDDELGLWGAMLGELDRIRRTLNALEVKERAGSPGSTTEGEPAAVEAAVAPATTGRAS